MKNKNEKYFLNSSHAALSSFQSSGRITADMRFAPRLGAHPNCFLWSQLLISPNVKLSKNLQNSINTLIVNKLSLKKLVNLLIFSIFTL